MAFDSPPWPMDATTQDAELFRRAIGTLISSAGGVVTGGDLQVTQNGTPNMTVNIGLGQAWVPGSSTTTQGPYYSENKASISQAINASNATNPRIDTIGVQVQDKAYAGSLTQINPLYEAGTATPGANLTNLTGKATGLPPSIYVLAYVLVPANATSIVTADILNVASVAGLGLSPLVPTAVTGAATALDGQWIRAAGTPPYTITLPAPTAGTEIDVTAATVAASGAAPIEIATPSGGISGVGVSASSIVLGVPGACVKLRGDGVNYSIVGGQQDTGWVTLTGLPSGWTTSGGGYTCSVRLEGDTVRFKGALHNGSGSIFTSGAVAVLPPIMWPAAFVPLGARNGSAASINATVDTSGNLDTVGIANNDSVILDGVNYSLT